MSTPKFGDVFYAVLTMDRCVQGGRRPVVIAQNNVGNTHSPTVEVIPMTSNTAKARYMPTHVLIPANSRNGLACDSVVLAEQTRVINMSDLSDKIGELSYSDLVGIGRARSIQSPFPVS